MRIPSSPGLTADQFERVQRTARELSLFIKLDGGAPVSRPRLSPGTPAFTSAARRDYEQLVSHHGGAELPSAFRVRLTPTTVSTAVRTFATQHRGSPEVALNTIDGHRTYQVQVKTADRTHVLLLGPAGQSLGTGVVRGARVSWSWA
ncbi:MAG: hypothetical protein U0228_23095 [Myxococcaceae bacterium]